MVSINTLSKELKAAVLRALCEGNSIRATSRMTGVAKNSIVKLLREAGQACLEYQDKLLRNVKSRRIQFNEIWAFCSCKDKNVPDKMRGQPGIGSIWTWTALDDDTKLMVSWMLGARDAATAHAFMADLKDRLANRVQLTTDGNIVYLEAVDDYFAEIDFAQLVKLYGNDPEGESRYGPAKCLGTKTKVHRGQPDAEHVSTSYVERSNLTMRMHMGRFTRLANGFSKKAENLAYAIALQFMYYNCIRRHRKIHMTPAVKAGIVEYPMTVEDIVEMLPLPVAKKRGPYKKRKPEEN